MPRSSKKRTDIGHEEKRITVRTDAPPPEQMLDPNSKAAIEAELEKLRELKKSGAKKPEGVTWGDWMGPKKMSPRHYVIANMVAMGKRNAEICLETGLSAPALSNIVNNTLFKAYVSAIQQYYTSDAKKRFDNLVPSAVRVYEDVLSPHSQEQTKTKVDVASKVFDRAWGRAQNDQQDAGNTVLNLLRGLKELNESAKLDPVKEAIEVSSVERAPAPFSSDDGSVADLLNSWEEGHNGSSEEKEEGSEEE